MLASTFAADTVFTTRGHGVGSLAENPLALRAKLA
jgi:hypothetical protein